jgi:hypothetical protein
MLFSRFQKSIFLSLTATTIELFLAIEPILAEQIIIDSQSPRSIEIQGNGNTSITAVSITEDISTPTGTCSGFISKDANHILVLNSFVNTLQVSVISQQDTTLIIKGPGGTWCNDDYRSKNPTIVGQWQPGTYNIWVGSYKRNTPFQYHLEIER